MEKQSLVSVIITTKNEEQVIGRLLNSVNQQTYNNFEVILVDNHSSDETVNIAKNMGAKVKEWGPERSAQRNLGAKVSRGQYLLFLDADMELSPSVLKECIEVCRENEGTGGVIIPEESKATNYWERVKAFERSFYNEKGDEVTDAARFFKKEAFEKAEGYDEAITGPEDWDLPENIKKKGYRIGRAESVIYHHERIGSPLQIARKKYYYALRAHRYLAKQKISTFSPKTIYFLRTVFYKRFDKILTSPILSIGMFIMLTIELFAGGLGYTIGRIKKL